jgi:5-(carboxyamino)imidazole ribonucleotide mutase
VRETLPLVAILAGSPNDVPKVVKAQEALTQLGVASELRVLSAHRTPELTVDYVRDAEARGVQVFIACAGMANHLAGVVAAHTLRPVIGVPLASGPLAGFDALLSTVQMPPGIPVAAVAVDGARNAGLLAARILALHDGELQRRLQVMLAEERSRYSATEAPSSGG